MIKFFKKNIIISLLMMIFIPIIPVIAISSEMNLLDKDAWYYKWQYWFFATVCFLLPVIVLVIIFLIEQLVKIASKLKIAGSDLYITPYFWILCVVIPVIGWILLLVTYIYLILNVTIELNKKTN